MFLFMLNSPGFKERNPELAVIIAKKLEQTCAFCGGMGHLVNNCATIERADKVFKQLGVSYEWGNYKSKKMLENRKEKIDLNKRIGELQ